MKEMKLLGEKLAPWLEQTMVNLMVDKVSLVMRKPDFCICENKDTDQLRVTAKLISAFVFATWIIQCLNYLNPGFQASSHLLWLYSPVCVRPGRKPKCWFSHDAAPLLEPLVSHSAICETLTVLVWSGLDWSNLVQSNMCI